MSEAAAKLPLLEELDITLCPLLKESLEAVGHCCPLLKSIKWNQQWYAAYGLSQIKCNEEAVAIAKNMPELRHLQIIENKLRNDGLLAILYGCPQLESLDLRKCFRVTLSRNLGKYAERIKVQWHPDDSTDNYEFVADDGSFDEGSDIVCSLDSTDGDEVVDDIHDDESFDDDDDSDYDPTNSY